MGLTNEEVAARYLKSISSGNPVSTDDSESSIDKSQSIADEYLKGIEASDDSGQQPLRPERGLIERAADYGGGLVSSINQGLVPFSDEMISGVRAAVDPSLYDGERDYGDRYNLAHKQAATSLGQFREDHPYTSIAAETAGGFYSPLNKLVPVTKAAPVGANLLTKAVSAGKGLAQNVARNATEAGIYGFSEGEGENRLNKALEYAKTGAIFTAGLDTLGRTGGAALDWWKLPENLRKRTYDVPPVNFPDGTSLPQKPRIVDDKGPIMMSNPRSVRAGLYKSVLAKLPGASERIDELNAPYVLKDREAYLTAKARLDDESVRLDDFQRHAKKDINLQSRKENEALNRNEIEGLARARAAEKEAILAQNKAQNDAALESDTLLAKSASEAEKIIQTNRDIDRQLNLETLQQSVPEGRRDNVTEIGNAGYNQALNQVNEAYTEAWGEATDLAEGTLDKVIARARKAQAMLGEADSKRLERIILDAEKLGESGGTVQVIDEILRNGINTTDDQLVRLDLEDIRELLRKGLPSENLAKLDEVDGVYPNLLTSEKAISKAFMENGIPTAESTASASNVVAGQRRSAKGEQPMMPIILKAARNKVVAPPAATTPKVDSAAATGEARLEKASARSAMDVAKQNAQQERLTLTNLQSDRLDDLDFVNKKNKGALARRTDAELTPLKETLRQTNQNARADNPSPYMAALLSAALPQADKIPLALRATSISTAGEALATIPAQEFIAGQGKYTRMLAEALRSGKSEYLTRTISRAAAKEEENENEDLFIYRR